MTFPTRYQVQWFSYDPNAKDELNNDIRAWMPAVPRKVIGWVPTFTERLGEYMDREITDVTIHVPNSFGQVDLADRCILEPDKFNSDGTQDIYEVVGTEGYTHGFHGWSPGGIVRLKLVKG